MFVEVEYTYHDSGIVSHVTLFLRCQFTVPHDTGLPEDSVVNTYAFTAEDVVTAGGAAIAFTTALDLFYTTIKNNLSSQYNWDQAEVEFINMADERPRVPFYTAPCAISGVATTWNDYPAEVAICMSMRGTTASGENARRRRGRVYIGPLQRVAGDTPDIVSTTVDEIAAAGKVLKDTALVDLCVYSRYTHFAVPVGRNIDERDEAGNRVFDEVPDALPASFVPVTHIWVDNAWDTQRRRGPKATYRKTET